MEKIVRLDVKERANIQSTINSGSSMKKAERDTFLISQPRRCSFLLFFINLYLVLLLYTAVHRSVRTRYIPVLYRKCFR